MRCSFLLDALHCGLIIRRRHIENADHGVTVAPAVREGEALRRDGFFPGGAFKKNEGIHGQPTAGEGPDQRLFTEPRSIGRVAEDEVERLGEGCRPLAEFGRVSAEDPRSAREAEGINIVADRAAGRRVIVDQHRAHRPPRQGLHGQGARTCKQVQHPCAGTGPAPMVNHVEQGFPDPVRRGAGDPAFRCMDRPSLQRSTDDPHCRVSFHRNVSKVTPNCAHAMLVNHRRAGREVRQCGSPREKWTMSQVSVERVGPVARIAMYNPPDGYMNSATIRELSAAMDSVESDPLVRAIVFTGARPDLFMLHYDIAEILVTARALQGSRAGIPDARDMPFHGLFNRIEACAKPTIAAINGTCIGGGLEFALCCDLRLAASGHYQIGLPEIRVGIFPGGGGTQRLARTIGPAAALDCILRARMFSPREAAHRGLVHDCAVGDLMDEAMWTADMLAGHPPQAVAAVKRLVRGASSCSLEEGLEREWQAYAGLLTGDSGAVDRLESFAAQGMPTGRSE